MRVSRSDVETAARALDRRGLLRQSLGWFFSPLGGVVLVTSIVVASAALGHLVYLRSTPRRVTAAASLRHLDYVSMAATADFTQAVAVHAARGITGHVAPVKDTNRQVFLYRPVPLAAGVPPEAPVQVSGLVIGRGWGGRWDMGGTLFDLKDAYAAHGAPISDAALIVADGLRPTANWWLLVSGAPLVVLLLWFCWRAARTAVFLRDRERFVLWTFAAHERRRVAAQPPWAKGRT